MLPRFANFAPRRAVPASRRGFLIGASAAAGGLVVGFHGRASAQSTAPATVPQPFQGYVRITPDNRVTVLSSQFEMGQGAYHGLATLVAEELDADWAQIDVEGASGNTALYGNLTWGGAMQGTGGSSSIATSFERYRTAGATARAMLIAAAADEWGVPANEITADAGVLAHASGQSATYGQMAAKAATMALPQDAPLKPSADWRLIGSEALRRHDSPSKANGTAVFTIDIEREGILTAVMIHPPKFGATVRSFDAEAALAIDGVVDVVAIPRGVAVVGEHMWAALKGRDAVTVEWDESEAETRGSAEILEAYRETALATPQAIARTEGDVAAALDDADQIVEATFSFPYLAHAALEPLNAVVHLNDEGVLEVFGGHQAPDFYQEIAAELAGMAPERVQMHVLKSGGSFGRRVAGDGDVVAEAVMIARALDFRAPIKLQWTRENDMRGGRYRPAFVHRLRAGLDADGHLTAWHNHIVGQSILGGTPFEVFIENGIDGASVEGASNVPYAIPNIEVGLTTTDVRVPVLWWRAVGSTHTAYAVECFVDEVARAAGRDPFAFRMELLRDHPRHAEVLRLAAERAGWDQPREDGRVLGLAVHESFRSFVAQVAEVSITGGQVTVHRVVVAIDCGTVVNPDTVRAQMEGSVGFGLGSILQEEVTITGGEVEQGNYDTYLPLRIDQMPEVEVHIVPSTESPTGVGEPGVPPVGPAVANAVYAATGNMVRRLPFSAGMV